jgi:hypothetical protein
MLGLELATWLLLLGLAAGLLSVLRPRPRGTVRLRRQRVRDITPLMRYGSRELGRHYRQR